MRTSPLQRLGPAVITLGLVAGFAVGHTPAAAAAVPATGELITNGNFDNGVAQPWWNSAGTGSRVENGQWHVDVVGGAPNPWEAQTGQSGIPLVTGRGYTLSFDASASTTVSIVATVQLGSAPYTKALDQQVTLSPGRKHYIFPFTSSIGTTGGQVTFQLGGSASGYTAYLDNISLIPSPLALTSGFYVDPNSNPKQWVADNGGDPRATPISSQVANQAGARWYGNWSGDIAAAVSSYVGAADQADRLPMLVAYNIPGRDCGSHSGGGAGSPAAYRTWISAFAQAVGARPAVVIIEPDALAQLDCLPASERAVRTDLLRYASEQFRDYAPNAWTYLDGGNATWIPADTMAQRLEAAGVREIRGFAVNVSNFHTTASSITYANAVNAALTSRYGYSRTFVVDTSRNGNGSNGEWCNPAGRKLGTPTQAGGGAELLMWIKVPGDSDGPCGIAPNTPAGQFDPNLAIRLINGS